MPAPKDVHRVFHEFADITSMHGVPRIINARSVPARIFWSIICLAAFGMFLWQSAILLQRYYSYPKKVNVEIVQRPVQFPAVSICNSDPLDILAVDRLSSILTGVNTTMNDTKLEDILSSIYDKYEQFFFNAMAFFRVYEEYYSSGAKMKEDNIILEITSRLGLTANMGVNLSSLAGIQLKDFIFSCRFMDEYCNVSATFTKIFDPYFFNCYTFQPEKILQTRATRLQGVEYGLSLLLFTGSSGRMRIGNEFGNESAKMLIPGMQEADVALASGKGARVVVHSPHTLPHPTAEGFEVPPQYSVEIGVKARENVRIRHPHGNCTDESASNATYRYTLMQCQNDCIQRMIMKVCNCVDNRIPAPEDTKGLRNCFELPVVDERCYAESLPICKEIIQSWVAKVDCRKAVYDNMTIKDPAAMDSCGCYPPCEDIVYDTLYSLSTLPENTIEHSAFYSIIDQFMNEDFSKPKMAYLRDMYGMEYESMVHKHISRLNVHIADSNIIKTTEAPDYEAIRLVSDIGGQLGLWIGISVMTLFEVLQLFVDVFHYLTATGRHVAERVPTREPIVATSLNHTYEPAPQPRNNNATNPYDPNSNPYDPHSNPYDPNSMYDPHEPYARDPRYRHLDRNIPTPRRFNNYNSDHYFGLDPDPLTNHRYEVDKLTTV